MSRRIPPCDITGTDIDSLTVKSSSSAATPFGRDSQSQTDCAVIPIEPSESANCRAGKRVDLDGLVRLASD
jgi:hypothetical protein